MARRRVRKKVMTDAELGKIIGDARAFREAAYFVERHIRDLKASSDTRAPLYGDKGWPSLDTWESLKTASHFNLQNAFELGLKGFLGSIGEPFSNTHFLKGLYAAIPEKETKKLSTIFLEKLRGQTIELKAFVRVKESAPPPHKGPKNVRLNTLKEFFEYFDKDVALWKKRYAWEEVSKEKWMHYIEKLDVFFAFLDKLEELSLENWSNRQALQS